MDDLTSLRIFLEVARRQSFAGAADHFGLSRASVSKHVARLEQSMQARLLNRTTQQVSLTRAGSTVVECGASILNNLDDLRSAVANLSKDIAGVIRIGVAPAFGAHRLLPLIAAFSSHYMDVQISLTLLTQRKEEVFVADGLDIGIIIGTKLKDASHSGQHLAPARQALVASPAYLARQAPITQLDDLARCHCLINTNKSPTGIWRLADPDGQMVSVRVNGPLRSNFGDALKVGAIEGMGIAMSPYYMIGDALAAGQLEVVLPQYEPETLHIFAIYAAHGHMPSCVREFLQFARGWVEAHPGWPDRPAHPA